MPQNRKQTEHVELKDGQAYRPPFLYEKIQKNEKFEDNRECLPTRY